MADQITKCLTYKDGGTIKYHVVSYILDTGETFQIYIDHSEMDDPTDMTELETLANAKAVDVKVSVTAIPPSGVLEASLNGDVTL